MDKINFHNTLFADLVLPVYLNKLFTYRVPIDFNNSIAVGKRVLVQFGKSQRIYTAIVWHIHNNPPKKYEAKYILDILDDNALLSKPYIMFWEWIASYYCCQLSDILSQLVPAGLRLESNAFAEAIEEPEINTYKLSTKEFSIYDHLLGNKANKISQLEKKFGSNIRPTLQKLQNLGLITVYQKLIEKYQPKKVKNIKLSDGAKNNLENIISQLEKRAYKQLEALLIFLQYTDNEIEKKELLSHPKVSNAAVSDLIKKKILIEKEIKSDRIQINNQENVPFIDLNQEQQKAYDTLAAERKTSLVLGPANSGKTYVFLKLIAEELKKDKQCLYLIPEIALTVQMVQRMEAFFGSKVLIYHSRYGNAERTEIWKKASLGESCLIVGPRSALFIPMKNPSMIVVDESHENTYKQSDPAPRYNAADAAIVLGNKLNIPVYLSSATPSLESYHNAKTSKFGLVELHHRYLNSPLPKIETINTTLERKSKRMKGIFSVPLIEEIELALNKGEQIILFQNRKGFVPRLQCNNCGFCIQCQNCDIGLTYYKKEELLKCHYCGFKTAYSPICPACGYNELKEYGYGTEKIEEEFKEIFPSVSVKLFDVASINSQAKYKKTLADFENGKIKVLIGTQLLSKGLDFENVGLVGIMDADSLIHFPGFRSTERAFQLMVQVSGRAGRRQSKGKVFIQTAQPHLPLFEQIAKHDFKAFAMEELTARHEFSYPPFKKVIEFIIKDKNYQKANTAAIIIKSSMKDFFGDRVLGPEQAPIARVQEYWIFHYFIKLDNKSQEINKAKDFLKKCRNYIIEDKQFKNTKVIIDVDPL